MGIFFKPMPRISRRMGCRELKKLTISVSSMGFEAWQGDIRNPRMCLLQVLG